MRIFLQMHVRLYIFLSPFSFGSLMALLGTTIYKEL